jgi:hypothetical protein
MNSEIEQEKLNLILLQEEIKTKRLEFEDLYQKYKILSREVEETKEIIKKNKLKINKINKKI